MKFRTRLLLLVAGAIGVTITLVTWAVSATTTRTFEQADQERTRALVEQFRRDFALQGDDIVRRVESIAESERITRIGVRLARGYNLARHVKEASELAATQGLDYLELVSGDGTIISSAQSPARFGYPNEWITERDDRNDASAFLRREEGPDGPTVVLMAARTASAGRARLHVIGGQRLDREFLESLVLPEGMRVLLYPRLVEEFSPDALRDASGPVAEAEKLHPLIVNAMKLGSEQSVVVRWDSGKLGAETVHAIPLAGRDDECLAVLLVGSSRRRLQELTGFIRWMGILLGGIGVVLGAGLSGWVTARVTRPVEQLAGGAAEVAGGNWDARVEIDSGDEIGELARSFNRMTEQLVEQREKLVQSERVAAWRELARRLAHELKNPLFPMQITVENLQRAKANHPGQFDEVFEESTRTLLAELGNLRSIVSRFSDFARMPQPNLETVNVNDVVRNVVRLFEARLSADNHPAIETRVNLGESLPPIQADPEQLDGALKNLVLNAMDAMPDGGTLTLRTSRHNGNVRIEISDTGEGLTEEECSRLFTPYYTTKQHGTGLGLAVVQSVVSDHGARISVRSAPGKGTTFSIDFQAA